MQDVTPTDPRLEADRQRLREGALPDELLAAMFDDIAADTVDRKPTVRDRVRELSTPLRVVAASLAVLGLSGVLAVMTGVRADVTEAEALRFAIGLASLAALVAVVLAVGLRGVHQRPLGAVVWAVLVVALGTPVILAVAPDLWLGHAHDGAGAALGPAASCFTLGLINGALAALVVWLFQRTRTDRAPRWRLAAAGVVGGLAAFWTLELHCPSRDVSHLLIGHASVGFVLAALALAYAALRARAKA